MVAPVAIAALAMTSHSIHATKLAPVIWQGIMLTLMLPFFVTLFWVWNKEPLVPSTEQEKRLKRKWVRIRWTLMITYCLIGVVLLIVLLQLNI